MELFKKELFSGFYDFAEPDAVEMAKFCNRILNEYLEKQPVVYKHGPNYLWWCEGCINSENQHWNNSHKAFLVQVEPIGEK